MTRMNKGIALTALAAGAAAMLATALPVAAQTGPAAARGAAIFDRLDADDNGMVSFEEFSARAKARFDDLDDDKDGEISKDEARDLGPMMRDRAERWGQGARGQGKGQGCGQHGMKGPRGGHGMQGMGPGGQQGMGPGGFGMYGGMQGNGPAGYGGFGDPDLTPEERAERAQNLVDLLDSDADGKLSAEELATRPGPEMIFNRVDADGDGAISKEEFDAAAEKFGTRFGGMRQMR